MTLQLSRRAAQAHSTIDTIVHACDQVGRQLLNARLLSILGHHRSDAMRHLVMCICNDHGACSNGLLVLWDCGRGLSMACLLAGDSSAGPGWQVSPGQSELSAAQWGRPISGETGCRLRTPEPLGRREAQRCIHQPPPGWSLGQPPQGLSLPAMPPVGKSGNARILLRVREAEDEALVAAIIRQLKIWRFHSCYIFKHSVTESCVPSPSSGGPALGKAGMP